MVCYPPAVIHPIMVALRLLRQNLNESRPNLGRRLGYHKNSIMQWEHGVQQPSLTAVTNLAAAFGYELCLHKVSEGTGPIHDVALAAGRLIQKLVRDKEVAISSTEATSLRLALQTYAEESGIDPFAPMLTSMDPLVKEREEEKHG